MSLLKTSENNMMKNRRVPNAFMLFVKEQKKDLLQDFPDHNKTMVATFIGKKWRCMTVEEKQVYFDKYKALKEMKDDKTDSNPGDDEKLLENEDTNESVFNDFTENICSSDLDMMADDDLNKLMTEKKKDELSGGILKNKTESTCVSDIVDSSVSSFTKPNPSKKVRRPPNAFVLFANERRCSLDPSIKKERTCHVNAILGDMWKELADSEKSKYYDESKRLMGEYKKSAEKLSACKVQKKEKRVQFKNIPIEPVGRPRKKKKNILSKTSTRLRSHENKDIEKSKTELISSKPVENVEKTGSTPSSEALHVSNEHPNSSYPLQHSITKSHFHHLMPPMESHHSCQSALHHNYNNNDSLKRYGMNDAAIPESCFGAGIFPPLFPSYPFNMPFWMNQQAMAHHMFHFPSPGLPPSPYCYNMPYTYLSAYNNAYFNSYNNPYSGRCTGSFAYASHCSSSASATNASVKEELTGVKKNAENPEDEVLIVDEVAHQNVGQNQENDAA